MRKLLFLLLVFAQLTRGEIVFEGDIPSAVLSTNRRVHIYVPPSYHEAKTNRYPVLYVHDGQNAFSTAGPHAAFGWGSWQLDKTVDRLIAEKKMAEIIMVAIDCSPQRYAEYLGPKPNSSTTNQSKVDLAAYRRYAEFLTKELKPRIDRDYRTLTNAANTGVIGSSMGGICSIALAWESPGVFGKAASLSGAFKVEQSYFANLLKNSPVGPKPIHLYLDSGKIDFTGGDDGAASTVEVVNELRRLGWKDGQNLLHFVDEPLTAAQLEPHGLSPGKLAEAQKSQHNELYWRLRAWRALTFMFPR